MSHRSANGSDRKSSRWANPQTGSHDTLSKKAMRAASTTVFASRRQISSTIGDVLSSRGRLPPHWTTMKKMREGLECGITGYVGRSSTGTFRIGVTGAFQTGAPSGNGT